MTSMEPTKVLQRSGDTQLYGRLNVWSEKKPLAGIVLEAVREVDGGCLKAVASMQAGVAFRTRMLLAVVTYCYAAGIYGSEDIEAVMREDATFRFLCGNEFPGWKVIQRFRRYNRDIIQRCLHEVLRRASRVKAVDRSPKPDGDPAWREVPERQAGWIEEQFAAEAEQRIERAMWIDRTAIEDEAS